MEVIKLTDSRTRHVINKNNKRGYELFAAKQYDKAFELFSYTLSLEPNNLESTIGVLLSDMAQDFEEQAVGLFEYYQILQTQEVSKTRVREQVIKAIKNFDNSTSKIFEMMKQFDTLHAESINGILFEDFKHLLRERDFKEVFEDLIFSTKIIFTSKSDFYEFLEILVENDYKDMSLDYIESLRKNTFYDEKIEKILQKAFHDYQKKSHS